MILKSVTELRAKVAAKMGRKLQSGEALCHFFYGVAIFTETHGEITFYSCSACALGVVALVVFIVGGEG